MHQILFTELTILKSANYIKIYAFTGLSTKQGQTIMNKHNKLVNNTIKNDRCCRKSTGKQGNGD